MSTPTLVDVRVTPEEDSPGCVCVTPVFSGVDRPDCFGWIVKAKLAPRLVRAVRAGAVLYDLEVKTDVAGETYVSSRSRVMGRHMNADLRKLGF